MFEVESFEHAGDVQKGHMSSGQQGYRRTFSLQEQLPLMLPRSANWNGISIEHHRQPPAECELSELRHTFCIILNECFIERRVNNGHIHRNRAAKGDVIIYPASSRHWVRWLDEAEFLLLFLDDVLLARMIEELTTTDTVEVMEYEQEFRDPLLQHIGLALKAELDVDAVHTSSTSSFYAESLATALSAHLLRHHTVQKPVISDRSSSFPNTAIQRVVEYIHDNLDHNLTLTELAIVADMSAYHLAHTFKQALGISPHQYILRTRIEQSKTLLVQGKLSIAEIATRVGFFDQSHFTRYFKRIVGITPQTLLRQNSKNLL